MRESDLSSALARAFRKVLPGCVVYKHADSWTAGIPDLSVTWRGRTAWIEVKYTRSRSRARVSAAQSLAINQLPAYLVWYYDGAGPKKVSVQVPGELGARSFIGRFDHAWVADLIYRAALRGENER